MVYVIDMAYLVNVKPDIVFPTVLDEQFVLVLVLTDVDVVRLISRLVVKDHVAAEIALCKGVRWGAG